MGAEAMNPNELIYQMAKDDYWMRKIDERRGK